MTVAELIKKLERMPPDVEVRRQDAEYGWTEILGVQHIEYRRIVAID